MIDIELLRLGEKRDKALAMKLNRVAAKWQREIDKYLKDKK